MARTARRQAGTAVRLRTARSAWGLYRETRRPGAPRLGRRLAATPRLLRAVLGRRYPGVTRRRLLALGLVAAVYVLSPLDAVPDVIPVVGWTDDSAVVLWFLTGLIRESGRFLEWEASANP